MQGQVFYFNTIKVRTNTATFPATFPGCFATTFRKGTSKAAKDNDIDSRFFLVAGVTRTPLR